MGVLTAGEGQTEVIEAVISGAPAIRTGAIAHVGKVGQPEPARRVLLPEDDVLFGAMQRPPDADAPLQAAANAGTDLEMAPADLVENGGRPQAGVLFNSGTTSLSQTVPSGSAPPAARGFFCDGSRGSCSKR